MKFSLYRILGNDLPPRHCAGQTEASLRFILSHEESFPNCQKRFLLNRILDREKRSLFERLIAAAGHSWTSIEIDGRTWASLGSKQARIAYLTNVNAARNACVLEGLAGSDIVLPLDGTCYFRADGWKQFVAVVERFPTEGFYLVPMWRLETFSEASDPSVRPRLLERYYLGGSQRLDRSEPQVAFSQWSDKLFDEGLPYSQVDKVSLLWRLGVPGPWDSWEPSLREMAVADLSSWATRVKDAGFVCRLPSGNRDADRDHRIRDRDRQAGLDWLEAHAMDLMTSSPGRSGGRSPYRLDGQQ